MIRVVFLGTINVLGYSEFLREAPVHQCLEVIELTRKYHMHDIEGHLQKHILTRLPSSAEDALHAPEAFELYRTEPSLARNVLRFGAEKLRPWAFYSMAIPIISAIKLGDNSTYDPPATFLDFDGTFTYSLLVLLKLLHHTLAKWDEQISDFYVSGCPQANRNGSTGPHCSRHGRRFDHKSPLYISLRHLSGILGLLGSRIRNLNDSMQDQDDADHGRWCNKCKYSLKKIATDILLELYPGLVECAARLDYSRL